MTSFSAAFSASADAFAGSFSAFSALIVPGSFKSLGSAFAFAVSPVLAAAGADGAGVEVSAAFGVSGALDVSAPLASSF